MLEAFVAGETMAEKLDGVGEGNGEGVKELRFGGEDGYSVSDGGIPAWRVDEVLLKDVFVPMPGERKPLAVIGVRSLRLLLCTSAREPERPVIAEAAVAKVAVVEVESALS